MFLKTVEVTGFYTNCYIIACDATGEAAIIDPGGEPERILKVVRDGQLQVRYIINTHGHIDHIAANGRVKEATGAEILIHAADAPYLLDERKNLRLYLPEARGSLPPADRTLNEGDLISIGTTVKLTVLHTPGHTPGGICLVGDGLIFTGDTLFAGSIGRTDLPGGSYDTLIRSIREKLLVYPDEMVIYPGHGPSSSLGVERATNPFLT